MVGDDIVAVDPEEDAARREKFDNIAAGFRRGFRRIESLTADAGSG